MKRVILALITMFSLNAMADLRDYAGIYSSYEGNDGKCGNSISITLIATTDSLVVERADGEQRIGYDVIHVGEKSYVLNGSPYEAVQEHDQVRLVKYKRNFLGIKRMVETTTLSIETKYYQEFDLLLRKYDENSKLTLHCVYTKI